MPSQSQWGEIPANTTIAAYESIVGYQYGTENLQIKKINVLVPSPSAGGNFFYRSQQDMTIIRIDSCVRAATSATFNIQVHKAPDESGENVLSSDAVADTDGTSNTSFSVSAIASGDWLFIDVSAVSGTPAMLSVTITCRLTA